MPREIIPVGRVQVATPASMALAIRALTVATDAVDERIEVVAARIIANDPTITDAARAAAITALNEIVDGYFAKTNATGLFTFPNASEPAPPVTSRKFEVNPAQVSPARESFHGMPTTFGDAVISVRSPGSAPGTWGNSIDPSAQQPTSGTEGIYVTVPVGTADGISRVRVVSVSTTVGGARAIGGHVATRFDSNDIKILRWTIGGTGKYALQRYSGSTLTSGTTSTLSQSNVTARAGDLVDLQYIRRDGLLVLTVNGAVAATAQLTEAQRATHVTASLAGVWGRGDNLTSNKLGSWQWLEPVATGTVSRRMVSVDSALMLPSDVKLNPAQKRQAVGPRFDIRDYGAKVDGVYLTDARTQAGTNYVWSNSYTFTTADIGKRIGVDGAGPVIPNANDGKWLGTITAIDGSAARVDSNAASTVTGARCVFGTTDDVAIAQAQKEAVRAGGGEVWFPPGRTIVTQSLGVENYVSWTGHSKDTSWVHIIQDLPGVNTAAGTADWLTCAGRDASNPLIGAHFHDFGVNAEFHIHSDGYGPGIKPLNIYHVKRCSIFRMNVWNTPATAVPFDHSYEMCAIVENLIVNPGRLAPSGEGPGGSGIGAGTRPLGPVEPTLILNNVIIGGHSASLPGAGHNGIFTEAQTGSDPDAGVVGYRIVNNVVIGMPYGISDTGSTGSIIQGNQIEDCGTGIRLAATTLPESYPGLHPIVAHNVIRGSQGPGETDGVGIMVVLQGNRANIRAAVHAIIESNQIFEGSGWGIRVVVDGASTVDLHGLVLRGNVITANGKSGIRIQSTSPRKLAFPQIRDNQIAGNGRRGIAGDVAGILVAPGTTIEGGRVQDNDIYDLAGTPTQVDTIVTTGATLTGVRRSGNTGDA